jgi:hypothetical protein
MILENRNDWVREILATGTPEQMRLYEKTLLKSLDAMNDQMSFNQVNCAGTMNNGRHLCGRKRIHNGVKSKLVSIEMLDEYLNDGWELGQTPEHIQKNSKANKGIIRPHHGHGKGGPLKGSTPWNKGRKETRINVLIKQSIGHGGNPNNSRNKTIRNVII